MHLVQTKADLHDKNTCYHHENNLFFIKKTVKLVTTKVQNQLLHSQFNPIAVKMRVNGKLLLLIEFDTNSNRDAANRTGLNGFSTFVASLVSTVECHVLCFNQTDRANLAFVTTS